MISPFFSISEDFQGSTQKRHQIFVYKLCTLKYAVSNSVTIRNDDFYLHQRKFMFDDVLNELLGFENMAF